MTDEHKQKYKNNQKQYEENMTDEEKEKHKKNIKTYQKSKNKKEEINNIQYAIYKTIYRKHDT